MRFGWSGWIVMVAACGGANAARAPEAARSEATPVYRFDWSPPCRVPVASRDDSTGQDATVLFDLVVAEDEGVLTVATERVTVTAVDGVALPPAQRARVAQEVEREGYAPFTIELSGDGRLVALHDFEEIMAAQAPRYGVELTGMVAASHASALERTRRIWDPRVGAWVGWALAPGDSTREVRTDALSSGDRYEVTITRRHLGIDGDGLARLQLDERRTGLGIIAAELELLLAKARMTGEATEDEIMAETRAALAGVEAECTLTMEATVEPATLRPRRARSDLRCSVDGEPGKHDYHEEIFHWEQATGCD